MWRGSSRSTSSTDHVSSASGSSVWFVYENARPVTSHASSQPRWCSSTSRRINSGMAIAGWVSLSCTANRSANWRGWAPVRSRRRSMSWSEQVTKKYCCCRRNCLPASGSSLGYSTLVIVSERTAASTAPQ